MWRDNQKENIQKCLLISLSFIPFHKCQYQGKYMKHHTQWNLVRNYEKKIEGSVFSSKKG